MSKKYRLFGAEMSPYSVKVRAYLRYKGIAHEWIPRSSRNQTEFAKHAKLPIVPLLLTPDDEALQDSTPIIERLETDHPDDCIHPTNEVAAFVSTLLEEFGDEWGNKWMFHMRWAREVDQLSSSKRLATMMMPDAPEASAQQMADQIRQRMTGRVWFVGSNEQNAPQIEASLIRALECLDVHLAERLYLFGARPAFADFSLWAQIYCLWTDPTGEAWIDARYQNVLRWVQRMLWPGNDGPFESWPTLEETFMPLLQKEVGEQFLPWSLANAKAIADGEDEFSVELSGNNWTQKPQKYHAKSLAALQAKYQQLGSAEADDLLNKAGCLEILKLSS